MNILVCVKQVPDTAEIKINPETNTLIRDGVPSIVNPFDGYALEMAARLKDDLGGTITVLSMGPDQAKEALKSCLAVGADCAILLSDRAFGGSDTLATSYIISKAIETLEVENGKFDLIFCGKQAIDGDTAQVGPEIAEHLGLAQATCVTEITGDTDGEILVKRETDLGYEVLAVKKPAVLTVTKTTYDPRYATVKSKLAAARTQIPVMKSADIHIETDKAGLKGSPTKVRKTYTPKFTKQNMRIEADTPEEGAAKLTSILSGAGLV